MLKPRTPLAAALILAHTTLAAGHAPVESKHLDIDLKTISDPTVPVYMESADGKPKAPELPEIGDPSGTALTPLQEQEFGAAFFRSLHEQVKVDQDLEVSQYIQSIGQKLAANSDNPEQTFHFFVVEDSAINAFAGPGGYIGVNSGLILVTESESELASVLGHEIAHVTQRHLYQALQASGKIQMVSFAAMLAAMLIGSRLGGSTGAQPYCTAKNEGCQRSTNAGQGLAMAAMGAGTQAMINFTRDNEAEADSIGMQTLARSEFDPRSMPTFFERMQQSTRFAGHGTPEFLLTHPVTVSRIADTRSRAEKFSYRQYPDSFTYQLIRAKLRVKALQGTPGLSDYFSNRVKGGTKPQQDATRYGLALALVVENRIEEGKRILQQLALEYPYQSHFIHALANVETDQRNYPKAMELFKSAYEKFPENEAIRVDYVKALLLTNKPEPARRLLEEMLQGPPNPDIYELLGQAYSALHNEAESHRYLAEAYYADGQTNVAILQMKLARRFSRGDFYLNSVIDDRLRKFTEEEKERRNGK